MQTLSGKIKRMGGRRADGPILRMDGEMMYTPNDYIAVFDSGVGGVSVLRQLCKQMPRERFLYYGDSANAPYGSRSTEEVRQLTLAAVRKIVTTYPVKALVVACNTATAAAIEVLREAYPDLIVIGIEPALKVAVDHLPHGAIGVMATDVTLREEKFDALIHRFDGEHLIYKIPAPGLVPLIEAGKTDAPETDALLRQILEPYLGKLDALVLGCTHYPFVTRRIKRILGPGTVVVHGGRGTARETQRRLEEAGLLGIGAGSLTIVNSAKDPQMVDRCWKLLGQVPAEYARPGQKTEANLEHMDFESLIFDIDGTLWDSRALVAEGFNLQLREEGLEHLSTDAETLRPLFGKVMTQIADALFPGIPTPERYELMARCMERENHYLEENECRIGYPGVKQTLEKLAEKHRLFIVSNSQKGYPELCMEKLGLTHLFEDHLCFGDTGTCKGLTIRKLMEDHGIISACYIGDTQGDQEAAELAGIPFIHCRYGFGEVTRFQKQISRFDQLLEL